MASYCPIPFSGQALPPENTGDCGCAGSTGVGYCTHTSVRGLSSVEDWLAAIAAFPPCTSTPPPCSEPFCDTL